jgi:hypothetical protein
MHDIFVIITTDWISYAIRKTAQRRGLHGPAPGPARGLGSGVVAYETMCLDWVELIVIIAIRGYIRPFLAVLSSEGMMDF